MNLVLIGVIMEAILYFILYESEWESFQSFPIHLPFTIKRNIKNTK